MKGKNAFGRSAFSSVLTLSFSPHDHRLTVAEEICAAKIFVDSDGAEIRDMEELQVDLSTTQLNSAVT